MKMSSAPDAQQDLSGRTVLVTGANAGIGYWCAEALADRGARVLLGCRSSERAQAAIDSIRGRTTASDLQALSLDLGCLESITRAAGGVDERIDAVICNAGVKVADRDARTSDGLDLMVGTNFLGHFALIAQIERRLAEDARVVMVGSLAHRFAGLNPAALSSPWSGPSLARYGRSKAALMTFGFELDRRWRPSSRSSVLAHPGYAVDPLSPPRAGLPQTRRLVRALAAPTRVVVQGKDGGALPIVHAATAPDVRSGDYWGPGGFLEFRGDPKRVKAAPAVRSTAQGAALWSAAEALTGVRFPA